MQFGGHKMAAGKIAKETLGLFKEQCGMPRFDKQGFVASVLKVDLELNAVRKNYILRCEDYFLLD